MPSRRVHNFLNRIIFGSSYDKINAAIDEPFKYLGRKHRILYHNPLEAGIIGLTKTSDINGFMAGFLHVYVDQTCSDNKSLKATLEILALLDNIARKGRKLVNKLGR